MKILLMFMLSFSFLGAEELPSSFDLRDVNGENFITYVKSQSGGTCWTHGSMAALESNLLKSGVWAASGESGEPNLSEYHLDWWNGFNQFFNEDLGGASEEGLEVHYGGDYYVAQAYFSRAEGAVRDVDGQSFATAPLRYDTSFHIYMPRDVEWYMLPENSLDGIEILKTALMEKGAMGTCMYASSQFMDDSVTWSFYQPPEDMNDPNHSIAIVGWNDTVTTHAPQPGAWLCKNSWGESWGMSGYFWISYYDKHCGRHPEMGAVSYSNVARRDFDQVYSHDYHGRRAVRENIFEGINLFESRGQDTIKAVSFYTEADSVTVSVGTGSWQGFDSLRIQENRFFPYRGYHTLALTEKPVFAPGDSFYVYLQVDGGGLAYDKTSVVPVLLKHPVMPAIYFSQPALTTVPSTASENESFVKLDDLWVDVQSFDVTANLCIKAYTASDSIRTERADHRFVPEDHYLAPPYPNPCNPSTNVFFELAAASHVSLRLYDISGHQLRILAEGDYEQGVYSLTCDVKDMVSGVYMIVLQTKKEIHTQKMVVLK